jgi:phosphonate transport system substrate-binding protein
VRLGKSTAACISRRRLVAVGAALVASLAMPAVSRAARPVLFGLTPVFLDSDIQLIAEIERYLSRSIGRQVQLVKRRTYQEITSLLVANQLDAAWICGFPFVQNREQLSLVAVPLYQKEPLYRAYVITRNERLADDIAALRGDIHAFSDPDSNSGFLVTRALLASMKQSPTMFFSRSFFTFGHRNVIRAVASGLAQSGSVDGYVWDVMREIEPALVAQTRIIRVSEPMGFPPVAASRNIEPDLAKAIRDALIDMASDPAGRSILATLRLDGFVAGDASLFNGIAALWTRAQEAG